ncbi:Pyridine nucleotide-disulphide oxidoreductase [Paucidesulfovibrio gracilis DSM 16080]|uniref:Pyridine nucleotide-disulphide oxidoreductase n=1 Tax=Paucidesulfovibrio gracilis DSM 16080 TaxID=1121449 RepID=A0A1T4WNC1_9BACT|nr:FAD-dependent oxidoreductase [Paucidesulfovibrio gracilis]SKA78637.1 Pyridine nucleotide-disulphide oxidoreductase [Paucidesulfovibrio gracilis DSM 16080]
MKYVLIGNGVATIGAIEGIRKHDRESEIVAVGSEQSAPYGRPLISYLLAGKINREQLALRPEEFYRKNKVQLRLGTTVTGIDAKKKRISTDAGENIEYDRLLVATGGKPFTPPIPGGDGPDVYNFTNLDHAQTLIGMAKDVQKAVVVGGGLIGLKAAESLFDRGVEVSILELSPRILSLAFDANAARLAARRLDEVGLSVHCGVTAKQIDRDASGRVCGVRCTDGTYIPTEIVVIAIGVVPNTELAEAAGLNVDRGIVVDDLMRTSDADVFSAGDVAQARDLLHDENRVVPIWTNAYNQGYCAGKNMAEKETPYIGGLAMNSISFYGLPTISVGTVNPPDDDTGYEVEAMLDERKQAYRKLVFHENRLVGYVLVGDIDQAGLYTSFIKFQINITPEMRQGLAQGQPDVLMWPDRFFDDTWNPNWVDKD